MPHGLRRMPVSGARVVPRRRKLPSARRYQLTERDIEIVRWIARHGVVTRDLVGRRFFWRPDRAAYGQWASDRRLRALRDLGLIVASKPYANQPELLRVTADGARLAHAGVGPASPRLTDLRHTLAVVGLAEYLAAEHPGSELITERELRAERFRRLRAGEDAQQLGRVPDAVLRIPSAGARVTTVAIELDLSRKDRRQMLSMIRRYDRVAVDTVWWYVKPVRLERVQALVRELGEQDRFRVLPWRG